MKLLFLFYILLVVVPILNCSRVDLGQGGAYVLWDPLYPSPAYDRYEWNISVQALPIPNSYYYWALQNGFVGGGTFYMGIQPYGSCPGGGNCKMALFSFFGDGSVPSWSSCTAGADGGKGTSCHIAYPWVLGNTYTITAALSSTNQTARVWTGTITDVSKGTTAIIGRFSLPVSYGLIGTQGVSFVEYYAPVNGGCPFEPYASASVSPPTGYNRGIAYSNSVRSTKPTTECAQNTRFGIAIETGARKN